MNQKSKFFIFIIILCILLTITGVCASDNQTESEVNYQSDFKLDENLQSAGESSMNAQSIDEDNLKAGTENENYTFDDFYRDMMDSGTTFNVKHDYRYDKKR